jgi:uncharacterized protein (DUF2062 family)
LLREDQPAEVTADSLLNMAAGVPGPLLLGCAVTGLIVGALAYGLINALWGAVAQRWWRSHERPRVRTTEKP